MIASDEYFPNLMPVQTQQSDQFTEYNPGTLDVTQQQHYNMNMDTNMDSQMDYSYLMKPQYPYPCNQDMLPLNDNNFAQTLAPADSLLKKNNSSTPWDYLNTNFYAGQPEDQGLEFFINNEQPQQFVPYTNEIDLNYDAAPEVEDDDDDEMCDEFDDLHEYMENEDMDLDIDLDQFEAPPLDYDTPTLHTQHTPYQHQPSVLDQQQPLEQMDLQHQTQPLEQPQHMQLEQQPVYQSEPLVEEPPSPAGTAGTADVSPYNPNIPKFSSLSLEDSLYESNPSTTSLGKDSDYLFEPSSSSTASSPGFNDTDSVSTVEPTPRTRRRKPVAAHSEGRVHLCEHVDSSGSPCGKVFSRPYDLIRHQDTIHAAVRKTYKCEHCGDDSKTFSRMDALSRHIRVKHSKESKA
ncbi:Zinc finger protein [Yarrowia sp. C11]|nr:Zinc finger protein [Yarrowia sp. C11]KAG5364004.1 Zinc finger protein [Yarrowia sp. E02]